MKLCDFEAGLDQPLFLMAGPCVIEGEQIVMDIAGRMKEITDRLGINYVFKASFDKANRTSSASYRGPGIDEGLRILQKVKDELGLPVITDRSEERRVGKEC